MEKNIHLLVAEQHFIVAEDKNEEYKKEKGEGKRIALRIVAAQNYFYTAVNLIEAALAERGEHSFNHENRMSKLFEDKTLLGDEITNLYAEVERNQRNKVTYRGDNGKKYENIKKLARLLMEKNG